jgi:hypothetical protein
LIVYWGEERLMRGLEAYRFRASIMEPPIYLFFFPYGAGHRYINHE